MPLQADGPSGFPQALLHRPRSRNCFRLVAGLLLAPALTLFLAAKPVPDASHPFPMPAVVNGSQSRAVTQPFRRLEELRARYQGETDPVRRARALARLGEEKIKVFGNILAQEGYDQAFTLISSFAADVESTTEALRSSGIDAERRPNGFRHLQVQLRRCLRSLGEAIMAMPTDERERFEEIRSRLDVADRELLRMLFPRRPGRKSG